MLSSEHILGSDDAHDEFLGICRYIYQRIMDEYLDLWESSNESPHGVLALISTLNTFTHLAPSIVHLVVKRPQTPLLARTIFSMVFKAGRYKYLSRNL